MLRRNRLGGLFIEIVCLMYALLFVYAAFSKLFDYESFTIQLGQSPILGSFAAIISLAIPTLEIIIAAAIYLKKFRFWALYAAYVLMSLFTIYIYLILNHSAYVPCSCGGILEKLGWREHFLFNVIFVALAIFALVLESKKSCQGAAS